jgi:hypothetical protein
MLGFRGHFATQSRTYSVTFTALRERRAVFNALLQHAGLGLPVSAESVLVVGDWRYAGRGVVAHVDRASMASALRGPQPPERIPVVEGVVADAW